MLRRLMQNLTQKQKDIALQFAQIKGQALDFVQISQAATVGDVFQLMATSGPSPVGAVSLGTGAFATSTAEDDLRTKYEKKLRAAAKKAGFASPEEMLKSRKEKELAQAKEKETAALADKESKVSTNSATKTATKTAPSKSNLPSSAKSLGEILNLDLLTERSGAQIGEIWNRYHSDKNMVSASIESDFYQKLSKRGKSFPMFVLPVARDDGFELFLLQFQGHEVYFTPLLEYQTHLENARPCYSVSFYTDLSHSKSIVLMRGELAVEGGGLINLADAQHLMYLLQIFYVTGSAEQTDLVEKFWRDSASFDYNDLTKALQKLT